MNSMNNYLTTGKPSVVLWKYCLPLFGSVIFQQLYNMADSFVAGKFIGDGALAAVGNSYEVTLVFLAFAFGCNIGCSVVISRLYGSCELVKMKSAISTTFISVGVLTAVLMALGFIFTPGLLRLINTPESAMSDSLVYVNIYTGGLAFLFFYNIATGIFSAIGDSKTPFFFLAASSTANIFMDILFVCTFSMGVAGVAWATFICQSISCVLSVAVLCRRLRSISTSERAPLFSLPLFRAIVAIAVPSILQQSFVSVGNIFIQSIINSFGRAVMAGYAAAIKLNNFAVTSFVTLGNGISNYTSQNLGAGSAKRVKKGFRSGLVMSYMIALPFVSVFVFFANGAVKLFLDSDSTEALSAGVLFLNTVALFYVAVATKLIADGVIRGAGAMKYFMISTFTDLGLRVIFAFILSDRLGIFGVWCAWPIGWVVSASMSVIFYLRGVWSKKELIITDSRLD